MESSKILLASVVVLGLIYGAIGHSYVTDPISRSNQKQSNAGCRGPACLGPCDVPLASKTRAAITVSRGDQITIKWPRNNHAGGFIRFAWASTSQSDSHDAFDAHVHQINCHETGGCFPDSPSDPNGGDSGAGDGSSRACSSVLTVPPHLSDGDWTLQWAWFGGAFALGDYYSCIDYKISGGKSGSFTPSFIGGDYSNPNQQKCKFFNTNKLRVCTNEPCNNPIFPAYQQQSGMPGYNFASNASSQTPSPSPVIPPVVPTPAVPTPSIPTPAVPTPAVPTPSPVIPTPSTTGKDKPSPAPTPVASTTGRIVTPAPTPSPSTPSSCAGSLVASTATAVIASSDSWSNGHAHTYRLVVHVQAQEALSDWVVQVSWPVAVDVVAVYDSGVLMCKDTNGAYIKAAGWASKVDAGTTRSIEVIAESTRKLPSDTTVRLNVFTQK